MASSLVNGSVVQENMSELKTILSEYDSLINGFNSEWAGQSSSNLKTIASEFKDEYESTICDQMQNFADACNLYEGYSTSEYNYNLADDSYNAVASNSSMDNNEKVSSLRTLSNAKSKFNSEMNSSSNQINAKLSQINKKLEATTKTYSATVDLSSTTETNTDSSTE